MNDADPSRDRARERFTAIVKARVEEDEISRHADLLNASESSVQNWKNGAHTPKTARRRQDIYQRLGVPQNLESFTETEWHDLRNKLAATVNYAKPPSDKPGWLHFPEDLERFEASVSVNTTVIVMTLDAEDDTSLSNIRELVQKNITRGVSYLYVIPRDCQKKNDLIRFARYVNDRRSTKCGYMKVMVAHTSIVDIEWSLTDYVWLVTKPTFVFNRQTIANLDVDDIDQGFEQLYKSSDVLPPDHRSATPHRRIWVWISHRRQLHFLRLMRIWNERAEWF